MEWTMTLFIFRCLCGVADADGGVPMVGRR